MIPPSTLKGKIFEISQRLGINLSKRKGQCFLIDRNLLNFIADRANLDSDKDVVLEIGPGYGFLTELLALKARKVIAVEFDKRIADYLKRKFGKEQTISASNSSNNANNSLDSASNSLNSANNSLDSASNSSNNASNSSDNTGNAAGNTQARKEPDNNIDGTGANFGHKNNIEIIHADALKIDPPFYNKLISNLPYNISGPLFYKLAAEFNDHFEYGLVMLQQDFINRLISRPHPKRYGRISVIGNLFFDIKKIKTISPSVFYPVPKVDSGIIEFSKKKEIPALLKDKTHRLLFLHFISGIFPYKNNILSKAIKLFSRNISRNPGSFPSYFVEFHNRYFGGGSQNGFEIEEILGANFRNRLWSIEPEEIFKIFKKVYFL